MLANGLKETTATTGTGTVSLSAIPGFPRFSQALGVGTFVDYAIQDGQNWEWGTGRVAAANTLERALVTSKFESGVYSKYPATALSLSGTATVFCAATAELLGPSMGGNTGGGWGPGRFASAHHLHAAPFGADELTPGNKILWLPFVWPAGARRVIDSLSVFVQSTGSATKLRIGVLKPQGGGLSSLSLLAQTSDISVISTGLKTATFGTPLVVPESRFMLVLLADGTATLRACQGVVMDPFAPLTSTAYARPQCFNAETDAGWTSIDDAMLRRNWLETIDSIKQIQVFVGQV